MNKQFFKISQALFLVFAVIAQPLSAAPSTCAMSMDNPKTMTSLPDEVEKPGKHQAHHTDTVSLVGTEVAPPLDDSSAQGTPVSDCCLTLECSISHCFSSHSVLGALPALVTLPINENTALLASSYQSAYPYVLIDSLYRPPIFS